MRQSHDRSMATTSNVARYSSSRQKTLKNHCVVSCEKCVAALQQSHFATHHRYLYSLSISTSNVARYSSSRQKTLKNHCVVSCEKCVAALQQSHFATHHRYLYSLSIPVPVPEKGTRTMLLSIIRFFQAWKRYGVAVDELSHLSDRELAEIGITRSDIPRIAWEQARH